MRLAAAAFQHETNTFAASRARFEDFVRGGGWPGLTRGGAIFETVHGLNLPIAGFIEAARGLGHEVVPLTLAETTPSGLVTDDAFARISAMLIEDLAQARGIDALYLDLHGAMVVESFADGEGELLARLRAVIGPELPLVASLDLHANLSPAMVALSDLLVAYRTYPHIDMAETGARAAQLLERVVKGGRKPAKAMRRIPFLIPVVWQSTLTEPARTLYGRLSELERGPVMSLSFAAGFPPADIPDCGPCVLAYGWEQAATEEAAERMAREITEAEPEFRGRIWKPREAVRHAIGAFDGRPVVLADTEDNPGAGAESDGIAMLEALLAERANGAAIGLLFDPEAARTAHQAGAGAEITIALGGKSSGKPFHGTFRVIALGDGHFTATGPFYGGSHMALGPMARLGIGGVEVVVSSKKVQAADRMMFRHLDIAPEKTRLLVLKSSVHFRADFEPIAAAVLVVAATGVNPVDHTSLPYRHLRPGLRLMPLGPAFQAL